MLHQKEKRKIGDSYHTTHLRLLPLHMSLFFLNLHRPSQKTLSSSPLSILLQLPSPLLPQGHGARRAPLAFLTMVGSVTHGSITDSVVMSLHCGYSVQWLEKKDKSYVKLSFGYFWIHLAMHFLDFLISFWEEKIVAPLIATPNADKCNSRQTRKAKGLAYFLCA